MWSDEYQTWIWKAGDSVPSGTYVRIGTCTSRCTIILHQEGVLPPSFDGHIAIYRATSKYQLPSLTSPVSLI